MAFENRRFLFGFCAILTINCLLYIIANVLPMWGTGANDSRIISTNVGMVKIRGGTATVGLWGVCGKASDTDHPTTCRELRFQLNWKSYAKLMGSRVFVTIACIFSSFSILSVSLILLVNADSKKIAASFTIIFSIGSLIAGIIGFALGIDFVLQSNELEFVLQRTQLKPTLTIGASSIIAIIAVVLNIVAAIASFKDVRCQFTDHR